MADMLTSEHLRLFWLFAMPGIIILYFRAQFLTGRLPPVAEATLSYLVVSIAYHSMLFPVARPLYSVQINSATHGLIWFAYILVGPMILGVLLGLSGQRGWLRILLNKLKLQTVHPIDCAWDWRFGACGESFVLAVLKNDQQWAGFLGANSFISSIPSERDIYIEKVYKVEEDGSWTPRVSGVWIAHGEIQSLEFWPNVKDSDVKR